MATARPCPASPRAMGAEPTYLALCAAAIVVAAHALPERRNAAFGLAVLCLMNWVFVGWTYRADMDADDAIQLWAIADAALGIFAIRYAWRFWLGWTLWALTIMHVCFHIGHLWLPDETYTFWLDAILLAELACFLKVGGNGVRDRLLGGLDLRWMVRAAGARSQP